MDPIPLSVDDAKSLLALRSTQLYSQSISFRRQYSQPSGQVLTHQVAIQNCVAAGPLFAPASCFAVQTSPKSCHPLHFFLAGSTLVCSGAGDGAGAGSGAAHSSQPHNQPGRPPAAEATLTAVMLR